RALAFPPVSSSATERVRGFLLAQHRAEPTRIPSRFFVFQLSKLCRGKSASQMFLGQNGTNFDWKWLKLRPNLWRTASFATMRSSVRSRLLLPRLGYKSAIWADAHRLGRVVWKILHEGVRFVEQGHEVGPREKKQPAHRCWREPFVSSAMRSLYQHYPHKPTCSQGCYLGLERIFDGM